MASAPTSPGRFAARIAVGIAGLQAAGACLLLLSVPLPVRAALAAVIVVALALALPRRQGRTLPGWLLVRARFRLRVARWRGYRPRWPIEFVVPGARTRGHADRAGNRIGLLADGGGWTAILRLDPIADDVLFGRLGGVMDELAATVQRSDCDLDGVQLIGWSLSAPTWTGGGPPGSHGPAVRRTFWVAARFDAARHPAAVAARGGGEDGAIRSAATAALRLATSLRARGHGLRVLDATELVAELGTSLGLAPHPRSTHAAPVADPIPWPVAEETWRWWSLGPLHHACFRPRRPPHRSAGLVSWFALLARPPAVTTCVSALYAPGRGRAAVVVRVAVPTGGGPDTIRGALRQASADLPARLTPLHGEHFSGVRATVPLAALF
ncbi:type VII secretion protein EccE [Rugosimonospora africana]|uniref:type VII secretion protein EccE n=1 Tax=Rugosimonospora africana TaxID=556532 RepID=UPI0019448DB1|nr:type VII secretion protein EccE [Rugosimonospora africana]